MQVYIILYSVLRCTRLSLAFASQDVNLLISSAGRLYSQADVFLRRHPKARIKCLGAGGAAARRHASGATPAEKKRHVADVAAFDARELGGRYRALRERVPCRSRYLPD